MWCKRRTERQNNAIRTNYIKARIDKMQQNDVVIETKRSIILKANAANSPRKSIRQDTTGWAR